MSKLARSCIFCGGRSVTKEHFWPEWCAPLFPKGPDDGRIEFSFAQIDKGQLVAPPHVLSRPGRVITKKLRVVCGPCNNTWMSRLETKAKAILVPMIQGMPVTLGGEQQQTLSEWIALKVMVAEHSKGDDYVTSQKDRAAFKLSRVIPARFEIWLGRCGEDRWRSGLFRSAATYSLPGQMPKDPSRKNTETVTLGIGDLLIFVLVTPVTEISNFYSQMLRGLQRLWPLTKAEMPWPAGPSVALAEADHLAQSLNRLSRSPTVSWRPRPAA
jgi:hypothetical protein